jgi:VCBS repeat protein
MHKDTACRMLVMGSAMLALPAFGDVPYGCMPYPESTQFADVTGDGRADAIVVNSAGITVRRSSGTGFLPNETWTSNPYYGSLGLAPVYFADVTGDGRADAIVVNPSGVTVRPSNGSLFLPNELWTSQIGNGDKGIFFADVDGDGKADEIVVNSVTGISVGLSTGSAFQPLKSWNTGPYYGTVGIGAYGDPSANWGGGAETTIAFADVNGDGRADAIVVNSNGITVRLSTGAGFLPNQLWTTDYGPGCIVSFADVNGDGRADAIYNCAQGTYVRLNTGQSNPFPPFNWGFSSVPTIWTNGPYFGNIGTYYADVTGDHKADAISLNFSGIDVRRSNGSLFLPSDIPSWAGSFYGDARYVCIG